MGFGFKKGVMGRLFAGILAFALMVSGIDLPAYASTYDDQATVESSVVDMSSGTGDVLDVGTYGDGVDIGGPGDYGGPFLVRQWEPGSIDWREDNWLLDMGHDDMVGKEYYGETIGQVLAMWEDPECPMSDWDEFFAGTAMEGLDYESTMMLYELGYEFDTSLFEAVDAGQYDTVLNYLLAKWGFGAMLLAADCEEQAVQYHYSITYSQMNGVYAPSLGSSVAPLAIWKIGGEYAYCNNHGKKMRGSTKLWSDGEVVQRGTGYDYILASFGLVKAVEIEGGSDTVTFYVNGNRKELTMTLDYAYRLGQALIWNHNDSSIDVRSAFAEMIVSKDLRLSNSQTRSLTRVAKSFFQFNGGQETHYYDSQSIANILRHDAAGALSSSVISDVENLLGTDIDDFQDLEEHCGQLGNYIAEFQHRWWQADHYIKTLVDVPSKYSGMITLAGEVYAYNAVGVTGEYQTMFTTKRPGTVICHESSTPPPPSGDAITVNIHKVSNDPDATDDNEYYNLDGAAFVISGSYKKQGPWEGDDPNTEVIEGGYTYSWETYAAGGYIEDGELSFQVPIGVGEYSYTVTENTAGFLPTFTGFDTSNFSYVFGNSTVSGSTVDITVTETPHYGSISLQKVSNDGAVSDGHGGYGLGGATYHVTHATSGRTYNMSTDGSGYWHIDHVPLGDYYFEETIPSKGFVITYTPGVTVSGKGQNATTTHVEIAKYDPVNIRMYKIDNEGNTSLAQGDASLAGAVFEFRLFDGKDWTIDQIRSGAADGSETLHFQAETRDIEGGVYGLNLNKDYGCVRTNTFWSKNGHSLDDYYALGNGVMHLPIDTTLYIREIQAPVGYSIANKMTDLTNGVMVDGSDIVYHLVDNGDYRLDVFNDIHPTNMTEKVWRGGFEFYKSDKNRVSSLLRDEGYNIPQGDAKYVNAHFAVYNNSHNPVIVNGVSYAHGTMCFEFDTDAFGHYKSAADLLPYGSYYIVETRAPEGYHLPGTFPGFETMNWAGDPQGAVWFAPFQIRENGKIVQVNSYTDGYRLGEVPIRGGFRFQKVDADLNEVYAQGDATFLSAHYQVINVSEHEVYTEKDGKVAFADSPHPAWYKKNEVCLEFDTNESGFYESANDVLPYGTYKIVESVESNGYQLNTGWSKTFTIRTEGVIVDASSGVAYYDATAANDNNRANPTQFNSGDRNYVGSPEYVIRGGFRMKKSDTDRIETDPSTDNMIPQGDARFINARFNVINKSEHDVVVNGQRHAPGTVCYTFVTDSRGEYESYDQLFPYGSYEIVEAQPPVGYLLNGTWKATFQIREHKTVVDANSYTYQTLKEQVMRGHLCLQKSDLEFDRINPAGHGDASIAGAVFVVRNDSDQAVYTQLDGRWGWHEPGDICYRFETNASGHASMGAKVLPYGTYTVYEESPSPGYHLNTEWSRTFSITYDGQYVCYDGQVDWCPEQVIRGGFSFVKTDADRLASKDQYTVPQGDATYKDATFAVRNESTYPVMVNGREYASGSICYTFTTNERGEYTSDNRLLPYGTYRIIETNPPEGYLLAPESQWSATFTIREEGVIVPANSYVEEPLGEQVIRGGFMIQKVDREFAEDGAKLGTGYGSNAHDGSQGAINSGVRVGLSTLYDTTTDKHDGRPQGDATLAGARFEVVNNSKQAVWTQLDGTWGWHEPGTVCYSILTDVDGVALSPVDALPYGTYEIHEVSASEGYHVNEDFSLMFTIRDNHVIKDLTGTVRQAVSAEGRHTAVSSYDASMWCKEQIIRGDFRFKKSDADRISTDPKGDEHLPQGDASYEYATFDVYNISAHPVVVEGIEYAPGTVCYSFQVDERGEFDSTKVLTMMPDVNSPAGVPRTGGLLPYGSYRIVESVPPTGYLKADQYHCDFQIRKEGVVVDANTYEKNPLGEVPIKGGFKVKKIDLEFMEDKPQGDAVLSGAKFAVINRSKLAVYTYIDGVGAWHEPGTICLYVTTDAAGIATSANDALPFGTYEVFEYSPSEGYLNNTQYTVGDDGQVTISSGFFRTFVVRENKKVYDLTDTPCTEQVIRGDVQIQKWDRELGLSEAIGGIGVTDDHNHDGGQWGTHLNGIKFAIRNVSENHVQVPDDGDRYEPGEIVMEITTHWNPVVKAYTAETTDNALPYGTYEIQEIATNGMYLLTDGNVLTFQVRNDGELVINDKSGELLKASDYVVRGDIEFRKIADMTSDRMDTMWLLTNLTTGEEHLFVTDLNGEFYSSAAHYPHSYQTNANDKFMDDVKSGVEISMSDVVRNAGMWFGLGEHGSNSAVFDYYSEDYIYDASYYNRVAASGLVGSDGTTVSQSGSIGKNQLAGALPYGRYRLQEVRTDSNRGFGLQSFDFYISRHGFTVDLGTITDYKTTVTTKARDDETGGSVGSTDLDTVVLIDTVQYEGLTRDRGYVAISTLMDRSTGAPITYRDEDGNVCLVQVVKEFTPKQANGELDMKFILDTDLVKGKTVVVFEEIYTADGYLMAEHKDLTDDNQTVYFPEIQTTATAQETGDHDAPAKDKITIVDVVYYEGLEPGRRYTMSGILMDQDTGDNLLSSNGLEVVASVDFVPKESSGSVELTFEISAERLAGHTVVAFEDLLFQGRRIAVHAEIHDEGQSVHFPKIGTTAVAGDTGDHEGTEGTLTIEDTVAYQNLVVGREYEMRGVLMDKATGEPVVLADGSNVTSSMKFVPVTSDGSVTIVFTFDAGVLAGKETVVFESLYADGMEFAVHAEIDDEGQTVRFPAIHTTAQYCDTGMHEGEVLPEMTIQDTVSYSGLTPGKEYELSGKLYDQETGAPYVDTTGNEVVSSVKFTPDKPDGEVVVLFTFHGENLFGRTVVVFEDLYRDGRKVASHSDIMDEGQSVHYPKVASELTFDDGEHEGVVSKHTVLTDVVPYANLTAGEVYIVTSELVDRLSGDVVQRVVEEFIPEESDGVYTVQFDFDSTEMSGRYLVATEVFARKASIACCEDDTVVARHVDMHDRMQTVFFVRQPGISTKAGYCDTGMHEGLVLDEMTIRDVVSYTDLYPGEEYTLRGIVMDAETGGAYCDLAGNVVTLEHVFTPEVSSGEIVMEFTFTGDNASGRTLVVFESLYDSFGDLVAEHVDIADENQSVHYPEMASYLSDLDGSQVTDRGESTSLVDIVYYGNLVPGEKYVLQSKLVRRVDGSILSSFSTEFVPEEASGDLSVTFEFDSSDLGGEYVVAFERILRKASVACCEEDVVVAVHEQLYDRMQTVFFPRHPEVVGTEATYCDSLMHEGLVLDEMTIKDVVRYKDLDPGETYTVHGVLMDADTESVYCDLYGNVVEASVEFVPDAPDGEVEVLFTFHGGNLEGRSVVVFEEILLDGDIVADHKDILDEAQTVHYPKMASYLSDADGEQDLDVSGVVSLTDTVYFGNLIPGNTYVLVSKLVRRGDGEVVLTERTEFVPDAPDGEISVVLDVDSDALHGEYVVAFESIYRKADVACCDEDVLVADHSDLGDRMQTVHFVRHPELVTQARHMLTGIDEGPALGGVGIVDVVSYHDFEPGVDYLVEGVVMDKTTGAAFVDADGQQARAEYRFTAKEPDGQFEMEFHFDAALAAGRDLVVFETAYRYDGALVEVAHDDLDDEAQTVGFTRVGTELTGNGSGLHMAHADGKSVLVDRVAYEGLTAGRTYRVVSVLSDRADGLQLAVQSKEMSFNEGHGSIDVLFNVDASDLAGHSVVASEYFYYGDVLVAVHEDIEDEGQTVHYPKVVTQGFADGYGVDSDGNRVLYEVDSYRLYDRVYYQNLIPMSGYVAYGRLVDSKTGEALCDGNGNPYVCEMSFVPVDADGYVDIVFDGVCTAGLGGRSFVAVVSVDAVKADGSRHAVASHNDLSDGNETFTVLEASITTEALGKSTGNKVVALDGRFVDRVYYKNLMPGRQYLLATDIVDQKTGKSVLPEADEVVGTPIVGFIPESSEGYVDVELSVGVVENAGRYLVVYESISSGAYEVCAHVDLADAAQTVTVPFAETLLTGADGETKFLEADKAAVAKDYVAYRGLQPGVTYSVHDVLVRSDGTEVASATETFVAKEADGSVEVTFKFDTTGLQGQKLVALAEVLCGDVVVAKHKDMDDSKQTVTVKKIPNPGPGPDPTPTPTPGPGTPPPPVVPPVWTWVQTGLDAMGPVGIAIAGLVMAGAAVAGIVLVRKRRKAIGGDVVQTDVGDGEV